MAFGPIQQIWDVAGKKPLAHEAVAPYGWFEFDGTGMLVGVCGAPRERNVCTNALAAGLLGSAPIIDATGEVDRMRPTRWIFPVRWARAASGQANAAAPSSPMSSRRFIAIAYVRG